MISTIVLGLMLSACSTASPEELDPTEPVPSESSSASAPTDIIIGAESTDIVDASGDVLVSLKYSEDGDDAVAAAVSILGEPTEVRHQDSTNHYPEVDGTSWGGFDIVVNRYSAEVLRTGEARLYQPAFSVQATSAITDANVVITAVDLTRVGDDFDVVTENQPANRIHTDDAFGTRSVAVDLPTSFPGVIDDAGIEIIYGAIAKAVPDSSTITQIVAPTYLFSQS